MATRPFNAEEVQVITEVVPGRRYVAEATIYTTNMYADKFNPMVRFTITSLDKHSCRLVVGFAIAYGKGANYFVKPIIQVGALKLLFPVVLSSSCCKLLQYSSCWSCSCYNLLQYSGLLIIYDHGCRRAWTAASAPILQRMSACWLHRTRCWRPGRQHRRLRSLHLPPRPQGGPPALEMSASAGALASALQLA